MDSTTQDTVKVPQPQFRLHDHLGNTVVYFHDKNNDGCITTEADTNDPEELEVIQRFWYYPFGMAMQGLGDWATEPGQWYRYNGKERDTVSGWYEYGFRWYIDEIGRWNGVDPLAEKMPGWSPYSYGFDNPISFNDPTGMEPEGDCCEGLKKAINRHIDYNVGLLKGAAKEVWSTGKASLRSTFFPHTVAQDAVNLVQNYDQIIPGIKGAWDAGVQTLTSGTDSEQGELAGSLSVFVAATVLGGGRGLLGKAPSLAGRGAGVAGTGSQGGLNLFKWGAEQTGKSTGWKAGDYMLHLPNKGTPALNWKANFGALRSEMNLGKPIFDSYRLTNGNLIPTGGFLNAERFTLQSRGWNYNPGQGAWLPPIR